MRSLLRAVEFFRRQWRGIGFGVSITLFLGALLVAITELLKGCG